MPDLDDAPAAAPPTPQSPSPQSPPPQLAPPQPAPPNTATSKGRYPHPTPRTRLGGLWVALTSGAVILLLLLIFILENGQRVNIAYFGVHGHLPLGVALLLAAVFGILVVVIPGAGRIVQLRLAARRRARQPAPVRPAAPAPPPAVAEPGTLGTPESVAPDVFTPDVSGPDAPVSHSAATAPEDPQPSP